MASWHVFETRDEMVASLAAAILARLSQACGKGRRASWAVSGGSTPAPLFNVIQKQSLAWDKVDVALVDERWVPLDHPRSNEAFVSANLIGGMAAAATLVGMKTDHAAPQEATGAVNARYGRICQPFDSILLGLGTDGHTASLFPGAKGLGAAFELMAQTCVAIAAVPSEVTGEETERMSLSARAIAESSHVALMITGIEKKQVLEGALQANTDLPIARLHKVKPFDVYWAP